MPRSKMGIPETVGEAEVAGEIIPAEPVKVVDYLRCPNCCRLYDKYSGHICDTVKGSVNPALAYIVELEARVKQLENDNAAL